MNRPRPGPSPIPDALRHAAPLMTAADKTVHRGNDLERRARRPRATRRSRAAAALLALPFVLGVARAPLLAQDITTEERVFVGGRPIRFTVQGAEEGVTTYFLETARGRRLATGSLADGESRDLETVVVRSRAELPIRAVVGSEDEQVAVEFSAPFVPGWFSILPPLLAIVLALVFREVVVSLFAGVWLGALALSAFNPLLATWRTVDQFAVEALGDTGGQTQIVVFSLLLGGMVGVVSRNGGTRGIVAKVVGWATTRRRGKVATWAAGLAVFFDDYANTLIIGNTMRPITDRLRISREKLAYLVDSTAAPVAAIVPISTWVGYEISLIADGLRIAAQQQPVASELGLALATASPLNVFIQTIPFRFYPLLTLWLVLLTSWTNRDVGPMATAEARAASGKGLFRPGALLAADTSGEAMAPPPNTRERWWNAAVPILVVIAVVLWGLYTTGRAAAGADASLVDVFGEADPFATLLWGSLAGCVVALALSVGQRILSLPEAVEALIAGMRAMVIAVVILVLAWSLGSVTELLGTANFLALSLGGWLPVELLPALVFVTAAAISFATGTSWGTMAILLPIVIPLTVSLGGGEGFVGGEYSILLGTTSSVLAGAIFGDHCSPISDTTVLSSMATSCDHVDHVRTQLPYALMVAAVAIPLGDIGTAYGLPSWAALVGGGVLLYLFLRWRGRTLPEGSEAEVTAALGRSPEEAPPTPQPGPLG